MFTVTALAFLFTTTPTNSFALTTASSHAKMVAPLNAAAALSQYGPAAASLFNNMKTPASILAGAMIPLGFLSPLPAPPDGNETEPKLLRIARRAYLWVTCFSFCSELLAVMWATVAVNTLTETAVAPAASVWHLLQRDCDLPWAAVNSHFVSGMLGFGLMILTRVALMARASFASSAFRTSVLAMVTAHGALMVSVVNRGVEAGGGVDGVGYGKNMLALFSRYLSLLWKQATRRQNVGVLELSFLTLLAVSVGSGVYGLFNEATKSEKSD